MEDTVETCRDLMNTPLCIAGTPEVYDTGVTMGRQHLAGCRVPVLASHPRASFLARREKVRVGHRFHQEGNRRSSGAEGSKACMHGPCTLGVRLAWFRRRAFAGRLNHQLACWCASCRFVSAMSSWQDAGMQRLTVLHLPYLS